MLKTAIFRVLYIFPKSLPERKKIQPIWEIYLVVFYLDYVNMQYFQLHLYKKSIFASVTKKGLEIFLPVLCTPLSNFIWCCRHRPDVQPASNIFSDMPQRMHRTKHSENVQIARRRPAYG